MSDEKKKPAGGGQPDKLTGKALDDRALDAVSGGKKKIWSESAWDWVRDIYAGEEKKEQEP